MQEPECPGRSVSLRKRRKCYEYESAPILFFTNVFLTRSDTVIIECSEPYRKRFNPIFELRVRDTDP
jgi:hypothetical protein